MSKKPQPTMYCSYCGVPTAKRDHSPTCPTVTNLYATKHEGVFCDTCSEEVTAWVRRESMPGNITAPYIGPPVECLGCAAIRLLLNAV